MMRALGDEPVELTTDMLNMVRNNLRLELHAAMPQVNYTRIKSWAYSTFQVAVKKLSRGERPDGFFSQDKLRDL